MQATTLLLTLVGAASALVARTPVDVEGANTLISYQPWCPVCDTVAMNYNCIAKRASCQASYFNANGIDECTEHCSSTCQRVPYVANSDYGYSCNVTRTTTSITV